MPLDNGDMWQRAVNVAVDKKLLPATVEVETVKRVEVAGRSGDAVAQEIIAALGDAPSAGCVVALQGPASTEKTAVVAALQRELPKAETWPMSTFFRAMTFLLLTVSEQTGSSLRDVLQRPEMLAAGIEMIDEMREGRSIGAMAADAERMMGMSSDGSKLVDNVPLAVEYGLGEVIAFVTAALAKLDGVNVLIDGREETLKFIRTPYRFELTP